MDTALFTFLAGLAQGGQYVLIALGVTLVFGVCDVVQIAHGEVYMAGSFATLLLVSALGVGAYPLVVLLAAVVTSALGAALYLLVFRPLQGRPHLPVILAAFGLSMGMSASALSIFGGERRQITTPLTEITLQVGLLQINAQRVAVIVSALILAWALSVFVRRTRTGMAMRAVAVDADAAALSGINVNRVLLTAFIIASALAGVAGGVAGPVFITYPAMGFEPFLKSFIVVLVGGVGSVLGSVVTGMFLGLAEAISSVYLSSAYRDAIAYLVLIVALLFRPGGLFRRTV